MKQDPVKDWPVDDAITHVAVKLLDLKNRSDLSESERASVVEAWRIITDAQCAIIQRLKSASVAA